MLVKFLGQCVQKFVFELSLEILEFGKNMLESKLKSFKIVRIDFKITLGEPPSEFKVSKLEIESSLLKKKETTQHWYKDMNDIRFFNLIHSNCYVFSNFSFFKDILD
jgi:hypothetical protein